MYLKKCAVTYVIWAIMLLGLTTLLSFGAMTVADKYAKGNLFATIGFVVGFGGILFLLYFLTELLLKRLKPYKRTFFIGFKVRITETILVVTFLLTAYFIRVYCMPAASVDLTYFNLAQVRENGSIRTICAGKRVLLLRIITRSISYIRKSSGSRNPITDCITNHKQFVFISWCT